MDDLKKRIRAALFVGAEMTAKKIAQAIGQADYPSDVVKALSEMRTDAEVECEKRGKSHELWYWLTDVGLRLAGVTPAADAMPTDKACCNAAKVVATTAGSEVDRLIKRCQDLEQQYNDAVARIADLEGAVDSAQQIIAQLELEAEQAATEIEAKKVAIELAEQENARLKADVVLPTLFCIRGPASASFSKKFENAKKSAMSLARGGKPAQVFAMIPAGRATVGAEWKD